MTSTATQAEQDAARQSEAEKAAVQYAEHGWPVLPGSTWNGRRYVIPTTLKVTDGVRPSVARNYATADVETVRRWWGVDGKLVPSVLLLSGETFNLVSVAAELAQYVIRTDVFRRQRGPVIYRPDEARAYFFVPTGNLMPESFGKPGEVRALPPGEWVAAPPTRVNPGANVQWWCAPDYSNWRPISLDNLGQALASAWCNRLATLTRDIR